MRTYAIPSIATVLLLAPLSHATTVYVDDDAAPGGDGTAWASAFDSLQDAIAAASPGDEIRVAQGSYRPDHGTGLTPGDQTLSFDFTGLTIRGGYAGPGAPDPDARDPELHRSVLSGDLSADDGPDFANTGENTHTIFVGSQFTLDGFEITGAAGGTTGAVAGSAAHITGCWFHHNMGLNGGALTIDSHDDPVEVRDCVFELNRAMWDGIELSNTGYGGAVYLAARTGEFWNCRFSRNRAICGGAVGSFFEISARGSFWNCILTGNVATDPDLWSVGGAIAFLAYPEFTVSLNYCLVYGNEAPDGRGGGVYVPNNNPDAANSIFWGNRDGTGRTPTAQVSKPPKRPGPAAYTTVNLVEGGPDSAFPPQLPFEPTFVDAYGSDGVLGSDDDDFRPTFGSAAIDAGVAQIVPSTPYDIRGLPRDIDDPATPNAAYSWAVARADLGPYEYQEDCDGSGVVDSVELKNGTLADCNDDGVPDVCQTFHDCDDSGVADECEIAAGVSADCNGNGIPDACDIASGTSLDVDGNGIPDECEPATLHVAAQTPLRGALADGLTWETAFAGLQDALAAARTRHAPTEIWLAEGVYTPAPPGGSVKRAFELVPGVPVRGGFAGTETSPDQRDSDAHPTILSGDPLGNDDPDDPSSFDDNALTVVRASACDGLILEHVTIADGFARARPAHSSLVWVFAAEGPGELPEIERQPGDNPAALSLVGGQVVIRDTLIIGNRATGAVVALAQNADATFERCRVTENDLIASYATVVGHDYAHVFEHPIALPRPYAVAPSLTFSHCTVSLNGFASDTLPPDGSRVIGVSQSDLNIDGSLLTANNGIEFVVDAQLGTSRLSDPLGINTSVRLTNSAIASNDAVAMRVVRTGFDTTVNQVFIHNSTIANNAGGVLSERAFTDVQSSIVFGNEQYQFFRLYFGVTGAASIIRFNTIEGFDLDDNIGPMTVANIPDDPMFADPIGPDGIPRTGDEDFSLLSPSTSIDSGDGSALPPGVAKDLAGNNRLANDPLTPDSGIPGLFGIHLDRGAYETQPNRAPADVNGDGVIDVIDFAVLAANFGTTVPAGTRGDINRDAIVDVRDFAIFAASFAAGP